MLLRGRTRGRIGADRRGSLSYRWTSIAILILFVGFFSIALNLKD